MKLTLIVALFCLISNFSEIHQDTSLDIDKNGKIIGLPKEYGDTIFKIDKQYLKIQDKEIFIPDCLMWYFNVDNNHELKLSASWYHSKELMPYYLKFQILPKISDFGYQILIDLESLELIEVEKVITNKNSTVFEEIKLNDKCYSSYANNIKLI